MTSFVHSLHPQQPFLLSRTCALFLRETLNLSFFGFHAPVPRLFERSSALNLWATFRVFLRRQRFPFGLPIVGAWGLCSLRDLFRTNGPQPCLGAAEARKELHTKDVTRCASFHHGLFSHTHYHGLRMAISGNLPLRAKVAGQRKTLVALRLPFRRTKGCRAYASVGNDLRTDPLRSLASRIRQLHTFFWFSSCALPYRKVVCA